MADASLSFNILTKYQDTGVKRAEKDMNQFGTTTKRTSGSLKKFAVVGAGAVAAAAVIAGKALFSMTKNAAADEAAQRRLAIGLRNSAGATRKQVSAVEDWISAQGRATGIADDEMRPALQRLAQSTGSVGQSQRQMKIAMDVSAGSGKSLKVVTEAMAKANNGNVGALSKLGLKTKDAEGKTLSMREALRSMSDTFKGQAQASAETFDGRMDRLKLTLDEAKETIGAKFLPVLNVMAGWFLEKGIPAVSKFGGWIRDNLGPIFERVQGIIKAATGAIRGDVSGNLAVVKGIVRDFVTVVRALWDRFGGTITAVVVRAFATVRKVVSGALLVIRGIVRVAAGILTGDWAKAWNGVKDIFRGAVQVVGAILRTLVANAKAILKAGANVIVDAIRGIPGLLKALRPKMVEAGKNIVRGIVDGLQAAKQWVINKIQEIADVIPAWAKKRLGIASPSKVFAKIGEQTIDGLLQGMEKRRGKLKSKVESLVQQSRDAASGFKSSFTSSAFGADFGGEDGTGKATASSIIEYQRGQAARASALKNNVKALVAKGLSKDLIGQLLSAGASGESQISALAKGSTAQIAELNSLNSATNSSLATAGSVLGDALYGDQIRNAQREVRQVKYEIHITGALDPHSTAKQIRQLLLELKRKERGDLGLA